MHGIFKFDISVSDELPFRFGAYGNVGSDRYPKTNDNLTHSYTINSANLTLHYHHHAQTGKMTEQLYSYWVPRVSTQNASQTYNVVYENYDDMSMMSKNVTKGLLVYFVKQNDAKEWVANDLQLYDLC